MKQSDDEHSVVSDDAGWLTVIRKVIKVLRDPRLALSTPERSTSIRGKAQVTTICTTFRPHLFQGWWRGRVWEWRLLSGNVVPIEIVSYRGSHISIGDHTFINYGTSITAYQRGQRLDGHCLLGHHLRIVEQERTWHQTT